MSSDYKILDLADLAAGQWGLFTTAQAKKLGFSSQRIARISDRGTIERLRHGVYRISGAPSVPDEQLRAAWLMIEPAITAGERLDSEYPAVASYRSAAKLHDLGDADADVMEFTTDHRKQSRLSDVRYRTAKVERDRRTLIDGLPVTTVLATIEDLAGDQLDGGHLAGIVRDAVTTGRVDTDAVIAVLRPYAHRYGAALGDGSGLLDRFLSEAGIPTSTRTLSDHVAASGALWLADNQSIAGLSAIESTLANFRESGVGQFQKVLAQLSSQQTNTAHMLKNINLPQPQELKRLQETLAEFSRQSVLWSIPRTISDSSQKNDDFD